MSYKHQQGFSLPMAIFILVILALLGSAAVQLLDTGQETLTQEILSTRAFYSAETGAQYVMGQLFSLDGSAANCQASTTLTLSANGINGCTASVNCTTTTIASENYYVVTSTGSCQFDNNSATRAIEVMAAQP